MAALGLCARRLLLGFPTRGVRAASGGGGGAAVVTSPASVQVPARAPAGLKHAEEEEPSDDMAAALRKNPDYHGFDLDPVWDARTMHMCCFFGISLCIVVGSFFLRYLPENNMQSWARREAEQRVKERERLGLPALDSNYFDPSKLVLPPEDEDEE